MKFLAELQKELQLEGVPKKKSKDFFGLKNTMQIKK